MVTILKKKYIYSLIIISFLLVTVLTLSVGYGLYVATSEKEKKISTMLDCFKIYYSSSEYVNKTNIKPVLEEEGKEVSPLSITVTNICESEKELQLRLNILNDNTVDLNSLILMASGNIEQEMIYYKKLQNAKTKEENVTTSKLIGKTTIGPNETVRTNVKLWFDEKKGVKITPEQLFSAKFELVDTEQSIKPTFAENLLSNYTERENPDYNTVSSMNEGLYKTTDSDGDTYYYRGANTNNYVSFADALWRIVRINPDNSVRLILNSSINGYVYSESSNAIDYTGLKYIYNSETVNNNINTHLENWYNDNIVSKKLDKYVATTSFCNDSQNTTENYHTYFSAYSRLITNKSPSLVCPNTNADFGGLYRQKIGLITADEVALAGGIYETNNFSYYLYNGEDFYTMTPLEYYNYHSYLLSVNKYGALTSSEPNTPLAIRPVISLESTITVSGSGTIIDPYTIDLD